MFSILGSWGKAVGNFSISLAQLSTLPTTNLPSSHSLPALSLSFPRVYLGFYPAFTHPQVFVLPPLNRYFYPLSTPLITSTKYIN